MEKGSLDQEAAESEPVQKHHVRLDGLQVSTRYFYEVYSGSDRSANEENFKTAPRHDQKQFSFLVLGDSGVDTPTQWRVGEQMRASMNEREADFIVHVGDVHQGLCGPDLGAHFQNGPAPPVEDNPAEGSFGFE